MSDEPSDLQPVSRQSTAAIIADQLRSAITHGSLPPGTQMGESDLAARLGVSRGPLREAMQRLVQEGLLRSERHRGLFVISLDAAEVADIYAARLAIEQAAVRTILRAPDRGRAVARLAEAQRALVEAGRRADPQALADADQGFHEILVAAAGSSRLQRMAQTLLVETRMCLIALQQMGPQPAELVREHRGLLAAIRAGDQERALALLERHMADAVERLVADITDGSDPPDVAVAQ